MHIYIYIYIYKNLYKDIWWVCVFKEYSIIFLFRNFSIFFPLSLYLYLYSLYLYLYLVIQIDTNIPLTYVLMLCNIIFISNTFSYTTSFKASDDYYPLNLSLITATRRSFKGVCLNYFSKALPITKKMKLLWLNQTTITVMANGNL